MYAKNQSAEYSELFGYKVPPVVAPPFQHGRDHPNFIRKEQCSFSWVRIFLEIKLLTRIEFDKLLLISLFRIGDHLFQQLASGLLN